MSELFKQCKCGCENPATENQCADCKESISQKESEVYKDYSTWTYGRPTKYGAYMANSRYSVIPYLFICYVRKNKNIEIVCQYAENNHDLSEINFNELKYLSVEKLMEGHYV